MTSLTKRRFGIGVLGASKPRTPVLGNLSSVVGWARMPDPTASGPEGAASPSRTVQLRELSRPGRREHSLEPDLFAVLALK